VKKLRVKKIFFGRMVFHQNYVFYEQEGSMAKPAARAEFRAAGEGS